MENLAHSLLGATLARLGLEKKVPYGTAALVVAANLPDLDSITAVKGPLYYFCYHRGITHSILGTAIEAFLFSLLLWSLKRVSHAPPVHSFWGTLVTVAVVVASHPLLDLTNSYGLRPFLPFRANWYYGDLEYIVDPYLWILLGGAVFLEGSRGGRGKAAWFLGMALLSLLVFRGSRQIQGIRWLSDIWFPALFILLILKAYRSIWSKKVLWGALAGVLLYWGFLGAGHHLSRVKAARAMSGAVPALVLHQPAALPSLANPLSWDVIWEDTQFIYHSRINIFTNNTSLLQKFPRRLDDPAVGAALRTCPGRIMFYFSRFPFFEVEKGKSGVIVLLRDARYARSRRSGFGTWSIPLSTDLLATDRRTACPQPYFLPAQPGDRNEGRGKAADVLPPGRGEPVRR